MRGKREKISLTKAQRATIFVTVITSFLTAFIGSATNLSIPDMSADFNVGAASVGWIVMVYMLPIAAFSVPFGRIADMISRKKVLIVGIILFSIGCFASVFVPNFTMMILTRIIQAVGAAMIFATNHAILIGEFPGKDRGRAIGYALAATYMGLSGGPVLGGIINHYFGWRYIFLFSFIWGVIVAFEAIRKLPLHKNEGSGEKFDIVGNLLYIAMILLTIYGLNEFSDNPMAIILVPIGITLGVFFVMRERKVEAPLVDVRLFASNLSYSLSNLAALLNYAATYAIGYLLSIYLQVVLGYSSQIAGIILIVQPLVMAFLSPYMGRLSDRISPFKLASAGMGLCALSLLLLAFVSVSTSVAFIVAVLCVAGMGFALFSSPNTNAVMSCIDRADYGVASSILATMRNMGQNIGMVIITIIVNFKLGDYPLSSANPTDIVSTMRTAYIVFTAICLLGIFVSMQRKNKMQ